MVAIWAAGVWTSESAWAGSKSKSQAGDAQRFAEAVRPEMYPQPSDRDEADLLVRRTRALLADVSAGPGVRDLSPEMKQLEALIARIEADRAAKRKPPTADIQKLYRTIALANPLLDFDRILLVKRDRATRTHMVDQFLGRNAKAGGGLFILEQPFGEEPRLVNVLSDSVVGSGRLKGSKLTGGCFLSPDLSFDGREIVFAYCECGRDINKDRPGWNLQTCFHLFRVNVDGSGLVQLTDGLYNDFDPCWLPNGRIAFVSERRGGYGRCHGNRDAPSYTLTSVDRDGNSLVFLSWHESNEWQPSVTNDGRIVYTRWDYVDRGTNQAHHPWITTQDGRDARAIHGNYPPSSRGLHDRPWMEMDIRAIPNSNRYVATAAGHHGQAYGSLVILDPDMYDEGAMSQLRRLTPEAAFPEAEGGGGAYATAWPLSEDYFLCANGKDIQLVDTFGGRLTLWSSKDVPLLSPIPLRPRRVPPAPPDQFVAAGSPRAASPQDRSTRTASGSAGPARQADAVIAVMNAYDTHLPWPKGTKLSALRIIQLYPQPLNTGGHKYCGTGRTNVRDVLGTVPLEADGSAYFRAPPDKALYFQVLDERGLAVQSMRSSTYVHPGESLSCLGCHDRPRSAPALERVPLALRREPSAITPECEGSNPFDFAQLVQPVFDRKCNQCHAKSKAKKMDRGTALKLVPVFVSPKPYEPSRTSPGKFGAMGSKLLNYLDKSHHGTDLTGEEFRRITLWMDCNAADRGSQQFDDGERSRLAEFAPELRALTKPLEVHAARE
ncbi:MAG: hypothetical protein BWX88_02423 [Planctomycetes bacterium ADurb.Bin126]|nr:MAG: hypothetical protein BWX88_02423 [Planctomycetes bacterium ADurb.Bin126]